MRLEQLRYIEVTLRSRSLRQAAQELGISQPSLSQQIQRLEEDLGVRLLVRQRSGIVPTDAARALRAHFQAAIRAEESMRQEASAISGIREGRVRIGAVSTACRTLLPPAVRKFQLEYPRIQFQVREGGSKAIWDEVVAGNLDAGIVSRFVNDVITDPPLHVVDLMWSALLVCVPEGHRLAQQSSVHPDDLIGESLIAFGRGYALRNAFERLAEGRELHPIFVTENNETARHLVSAGVGITILPGASFPTGVPDPGMALIPLDVPWKDTVMSVVRRLDEQPAPAVRALLALLRESSAAFGDGGVGGGAVGGAVAAGR